MVAGLISIVIITTFAPTTTKEQEPVRKGGYQESLIIAITSYSISIICPIIPRGFARGNGWKCGVIETRSGCFKDCMYFSFLMYRDSREFQMRFCMTFGTDGEGGCRGY